MNSTHCGSKSRFFRSVSLLADGWCNERVAIVAYFRKNLNLFRIISKWKVTSTHIEVARTAHRETTRSKIHTRSYSHCPYNRCEENSSQRRFLGCRAAWINQHQQSCRSQACLAWRDDSWPRLMCILWTPWAWAISSACSISTWCQTTLIGYSFVHAGHFFVHWKFCRCSESL